jgi:hypothetical protein
LLFSIFRLANYTTSAHVHRRFREIEKHYRADSAFGVNFIRYYDEISRVGCHVVWQAFKNENYRRCHEDEEQISGFTGSPFGYSQILSSPSTGLESISDRLARHLVERPGDIELMHPPFTLFHISKRTNTATILTDVAGFTRTFRLESDGGFAVSNRPLVPFFLTLTKPTLSALGWAALEANGYIFGELSPFEGLKRNPPGAAFKIAPNEIRLTQNEAVLRWFCEPAPDPFVGLDRLAREVQILRDDEVIDVGISGGRDSRASAAWSYRYFGNRVRGRTTYPPRLEREIARSLAERAPGFYKFDDDDHAVRADGTTLWKGNLRRPPRRQYILKRAADWAYLREGSGIASALYQNCGAQSVFSPRETNGVSVPGIGGELAKAYAYRPMQVSGVYAKDIRKWMEEVRTIPAYKRLASHPSTAQKAKHFARGDYLAVLEDYISAAYAKAQDAGISGYRFFDYWYLVGRMAGAQTQEEVHTAMLLPFLVPEFIRAGGTDTLERKINVQLSRDMVATYVPAWSDVPYFDEIQNQRPQEDLRFFSEEEYLWRPPNDRDFFNIIEESPAFDEPYDRSKIISEYHAARDQNAPSAALNVLAHGLLYRHAVYELAQDVGEKIANLRRLRIRRWKED